VSMLKCLLWKCTEFFWWWHLNFAWAMQGLCNILHNKNL
jgi:hypothetical protein